MSVQNFMPIHPIVFEIFQSGPMWRSERLKRVSVFLKQQTLIKHRDNSTFVEDYNTHCRIFLAKKQCICLLGLLLAQLEQRSQIPTQILYQNRHIAE